MTKRKDKHAGVLLAAQPNGSKAQHDINTQDGATIATAGKANARRLVACWNACDGSDVEVLEKLGADYIKPLLDLINQRDELLAALQAAVKAGIIDINGEPDLARAAIARATGAPA